MIRQSVKEKETKNIISNILFIASLKSYLKTTTKASIDVFMFGKYTNKFLGSSGLIINRGLLPFRVKAKNEQIYGHDGILAMKWYKI